MKHTLLFICILCIHLIGCMKSQIKDSLIAQTHEQQFSIATVLSVDFEDEKFAGCVQRGLKNELTEISFIPGDRFRHALYPWFEPSTAPKEIGELLVILSKAPVIERIKTLGVELLIYVYGDTFQSRFDGDVDASSGVAVGYLLAERETHILTTVWNLNEKIIIGNTDVNFQGTVHLPILGLPIVIPALTESSACSETVKRISNSIRGNSSPKEKINN